MTFLVTPEVVSELADHKRFSQFGLDREDFEGLLGPGESVPYREFLSRLFELYGKIREKRLVGNKTAPFVRLIQELHSPWPEAKFVYIVRDVCLSILEWESAEAAGRYTAWEVDPISITALWWQRKVLLGREGGGPLGLYHEVRYKSLISDPAKECERLCGFLGVPYDGAMTRLDERRGGKDLERSHPTMPITAGLRDWRSQMPRESVERFEAAAGDLLEELGYPLATSPKPGAMEHAARMREYFARDASSRGKRLPTGWEA